MDLEIGSNLYRNTDGTVEIQGIPQIQISLREPAKTVLVNFALFDGTGKVMAKLVDSTLMFNERRAYEVSKTSSRVTLTHTDSKKVVLEIALKTPNVIALTKGSFHSVKGNLVEVSDKEWKIDRQQASGTTEDAAGGAVRIG
ncbi:hypothetical protein W02_41930 [Nitrospira sp. KM1]|uniref:hypothetical protein n=1 Tax=Nitrospira sp. KM1 TaxID=1936990 RepID=UPI0013A73F8E|nr:hypothetical protein [Nitrospira sp. KM1]BCA57053.1 hypothetical protein W02_41930 [Nitrospira sp. KM1]